MSRFSKRSVLFKTGVILVLVTTIFTILVLAIAYSQKDKLLNEAVQQLNQNFEGRIAIAEAKLTPFENFPYISLDLRQVEVHQTKSLSSDTIVYIEDAYVGFDALSILSGSFEVKKIKMKNGFIRLVQNEDGSLNITKALTNDNPDQQSSESTQAHLKLEAIELINVDILKLNKETNILMEAFIETATSSFKSTEKKIEVSLESSLLFNLLIDNDTSFLHHKHITLNTAFEYDLEEKILKLSPSELLLEKAQFLMEGNMDIDDDLNLDLKFSGQKPNFDLFLAFAPEELAPLLNRYENGGDVYFNAMVKGPSTNGKSPHIVVDFGCAEAFVENVEVEKEVNELFFKGHFTNGELNNASTMLLSIQDFSATPGTGLFKGNVIVKNFEAPDINMQVDSQFDVDFLAQFLGFRNLEDVSGNISLKMNFHDIIDLDDPSKAIEKLNESYFTSLKVTDLNFKSPDFHLPINDVNIKASVDGKAARIDEFRFKSGKSDLSFTASISDLPALVHHTDLPVDVNLDISSDLLDFAELTQAIKDSTGFYEQIKNLSMGFRFNSTAKALTESPNLPLGEFFVKKLNAELTNYPHRLHDFNVDIMIDTIDFNVLDFTGYLDNTDFHFDGTLGNYDIWFEEKPKGLTTIDFNLTSDLLQLKDLFSYGGENYIPKDYRSEEFQNLKIHAFSTLNFDEKLTSAELQIDQIQAYMKVHKMNFKRFSGLLRMDSTIFEARDFGGQIGRSDFKTNLKFFRKRINTDEFNSFSLSSSKLDFDQLFSYLPPSTDEETNADVHSSAFNIFEVPFSNMHFDISIDNMNYHKYLLEDFELNGKMQSDHFIYIDKMALNTSGGAMNLQGYFNGSDPKSIYFSPDMNVENFDLDKLLFKFDNFGQDQLISDNLKGRLSGTVKGKVKMHPDLIPIINDSELSMNISVLDGSLNNFAAFEALSSYFTDKNLSKVRFDTLQNTLELKNGELIIPNMNINTSLGYFEIGGRQGIDQTMDYAIRIPMKVITRAGAQKLFGKKDQDNSDQIDEIQYRDETKRTRFLNIKIEGTPDDFDISLGKEKKQKD